LKQINEDQTPVVVLAGSLLLNVGYFSEWGFSTACVLGRDWFFCSWYSSVRSSGSQGFFLFII